MTLRLALIIESQLSYKIFDLASSFKAFVSSAFWLFVQQEKLCMDGKVLIKKMK